jgi:ubiquinone/menaquinone biosynthesis C-methylase UbiE
VAGKNIHIFNAIAPIYALFYKKQKNHYSLIFDRVCDHIGLNLYDTVLDVGCGTGALCSVLHEKKFLVTGIDPAEKMLNFAKRQPENKKIRFIRADVLEQLPFEDRAFDISIASYVAHGLQKDERKQMYAEMSRVSKSKVIIYDYNQNRTPMISMIEWLERGDYFGFIKDAKNEMANCVLEMKECFSEIKIVDVDKRASWYICTPN